MLHYHQSIGDLTRFPRHVRLAGLAVYVTSGVYVCGVWCVCVVDLGVESF